MSRGINKVIILGNLGQDPAVKYLPSGNAVVNFTVATSEQWKEKESGDKKERTEWHRVVAFGKLAEICGEYLTKGSKVYVEGKLQTRKWDDKQGVTHYTTEIHIHEMQMLGDKPSSGQAESRASGMQNDRSPGAGASRGDEDPDNIPGWD